MYITYSVNRLSRSLDIIYLFNVMSNVIFNWADGGLV